MALEHRLSHKTDGRFARAKQDMLRSTHANNWRNECVLAASTVQNHDGEHVDKEWLSSDIRKWKLFVLAWIGLRLPKV